MSTLPRQIDRRIKQALAAVDRPWTVVKRRDHYFIEFDGGPTLCIGGNSSKQKEFLVKVTLDNLKRLCGKGDDQ